MKIPIVAILLTSVKLLAGEPSWEIVRAVTEQVSDEKIKITVTVRNLDNQSQIVPRSPYEGQDQMALPNSFLWPRNLTEKEAMRPLLSHYYTHNSRSCHPADQLVVPPAGEVSFIMHDEIATVGKRLLLVFDSGSVGFPDEAGYRPIGSITVGKPKPREVTDPHAP